MPRAKTKTKADQAKQTTCAHDCPCKQFHYDGDSIHVFSTGDRFRWYCEPDGSWIQRRVTNETHK